MEPALTLIITTKNYRKPSRNVIFFFIQQILLFMPQSLYWIQCNVTSGPLGSISTVNSADFSVLGQYAPLVRTEKLWMCSRKHLVAPLSFAKQLNCSWAKSWWKLQGPQLERTHTDSKGMILLKRHASSNFLSGGPDIWAALLLLHRQTQNCWWLKSRFGYCIFKISSH